MVEKKRPKKPGKRQAKGHQRGKSGWFRWRRMSNLRRAAILGYGLLVIAAACGLYHLLSPSAPTARPIAAAPVAPMTAATGYESSAEVVIPPHVKPPVIPPELTVAVPPPMKSRSRKGPRIVIIIDDVGPDLSEAREAIRLDPGVTLSFLPYAQHVRALASEARAAGHEIILHLPMEPQSRHFNPGPHALLTELPPDELERRLIWNLGQFDGYVGVNNHMGSLFTTNRQDMTAVMQLLKARGLIFLDSRTISGTVAGQVAKQVGIAFAERDVFLDNVQNSAAIELQLEKLVTIARKRGFAIAIGHPHPVTLKKLKLWLPKLEAMGVTLAPLSKVAGKASPGVEAKADGPAIP